MNQLDIVEAVTGTACTMLTSLLLPVFFYLRLHAPSPTFDPEKTKKSISTKTAKKQSGDLECPSNAIAVNSAGGYVRLAGGDCDASFAASLGLSLPMRVWCWLVLLLSCLVCVLLSMGDAMTIVRRFQSGADSE